MQDTIKKFHQEAFAKSAAFEADVDDFFDKGFYKHGLYVLGLNIEKYTSGDTMYKHAKPLTKSYLTHLPSKISRRYSPQNQEQNSGAPIPLDPTFMKDNTRPERIRTVRSLFHQKEENDEIDGTSLYQVSKNETPEQDLLNSKNVKQVERIIVTSSDVESKSDFNSKIVIESIPEKKYDNIDVVPIGYDNLSQGHLNKAINLNKTTLIAPKTTSQVYLSHVISDENNFDNTNESVVQKTSQNLINLVDRRIKKQNEPEITSINDAPLVIRQVIDEFSEMKERNKKEQQAQIKTIENRVQKIIKSELPDDIEEEDEVVKEIREIIKEVVENHPQISHRKNDNNEMQLSLTAKDTLLRIQIEQELKEKFENRITDNNKLMEKKSRVMFEEMMQRFLNP